MTELVLNISRVGIDSLSNFSAALIRSLNKQASRAHLVFIGITLVFLQILDGLLTGIGVANFGPTIEANLLIRGLIISLGIVPALLLIKGIAIIIVGTLCTMAHRVHWLASALKFIIVLYLFAAIVPWTLVLTFRTV